MYEETGLDLEAKIMAYRTNNGFDVDSLLLLYYMCNVIDYCKAKGINKHELDSTLLNQWNAEMLIRLEMYVSFCLAYDISLDDENSIELNKGAIDSIVSIPGQHYTGVISPFASVEWDGKRIGKENGILVLNQGEPFIINGSKLERSQVAGLYHTHNPYSEQYIEPLGELCDSGYGVCYGVFGALSDKNKVEKLQQLKKFALQRSSEINFEYETSGDGYYAAVYKKQHKPHVKGHIKRFEGYSR